MPARPGTPSATTPATTTSATSPTAISLLEALGAELGRAGWATDIIVRARPECSQSSHEPL